MPHSDCFQHIANWTFLNQGNNIAAFLCLIHKVVFKFVIRKSGFSGYLRQRQQFCQKIISLFPEFAQYDPDHHEVFSFECLGNKEDAIRLLEEKGNIIITDKEDFATCVDVTNRISQIVISVGGLEMDDSMINIARPVTLLVELKPKSGAWCHDEQFSSLGRFNRHILVQRNRGVDDFLYNPGDLFSENTETRRNCIYTMLQHQSHYLNVYHDGCKINSSNSFVEAGDNLTLDEFSTLIADLLDDCQILKPLKSVQKLSSLSASYAFDCLHREIEKHGDKTNFLMLSNLEDLVFKLRQETTKNAELTDEFLNSLSCLEYIQAFLLGALMADVSIIFGLYFVSNDSYWKFDRCLLESKNVGSRKFGPNYYVLYICNLLDIDFKNTKTIRKQYEDLKTAANRMEKSSKIECQQ